MMELFIETLTGTAFELRVSPFETIMSVKAKIQRLEGIPISQQHLIWQSMELEDDYCLHDYSIHDGATLKLVLAMRGGPINTRRIAMEDPALREMAEYMEANREEILDKLPGNRQVTLLVYREGDQLNFFRVVDRGDGTLTPLSESLSPLHFSGTSMYNLYDDEEDEEQVTREAVEENVKTKEKMQLLRSKMENLTLTKKPKKKIVPRPPSSGRPGSRTRSSAHRLTSSSGHASRQYQHSLATLSKTPLPPLGQTHVRSASGTANPEPRPVSGRSSTNSILSLANNGAETPVTITEPVSVNPSSARRNGHETLESAKHKRPLSSVKEDYSGSTARAPLGLKANVKATEAAVANLGKGMAVAAVSPVSEELVTRDTGDAQCAVDKVDAKSAAGHGQQDAAADATSVVAAAAAAASADPPQLLKSNLPLPSTSYSQKTLAQQDLVDLPSPDTAASAATSNALQSDWMPSWSAATHSYSTRKKELLSHSMSMRPPTSSNKGLERLIDHHHHGYESSLDHPTSSASPSSSSKRSGKEQLTTLENLVRPPTSKYSNLDRKQGLILESLSQSEARGLLRQASIERLGSSKLANFVRSASKSRTSYNLGSANLREGSRVGTPEGRLVSGRLQHRMSARGERDRLSPTPRLPPVKQKKKASKRCFVCAKRTGLATSYHCRCGNNFCATHRYAESHDCTFDYKTEGRKLLEQANPVVSAPKLPKI